MTTCVKYVYNAQKANTLLRGTIYEKVTKQIYVAKDRVREKIIQAYPQYIKYGNSMTQSMHYHNPYTEGPLNYIYLEELNHLVKVVDHELIKGIYQSFLQKYPVDPYKGKSIF